MIAALDQLIDEIAAGRVSRRQAVLRLTAWSLAACGARRVLAAAPAATQEAATFRATGLNHLGLRVSEVARSRDFYCRHLGMTVIRDHAPGNCFLRAGEHYVGLFRAPKPGVDHFCFTVEGYEADQALARLQAAGFAPRREEDRVYFDDPDGLEVQLDSRFGSWPGPPPEGID